MDLWIRSQDKERLWKIVFIEYDKDDYGHHLIGWKDKFEGTSLATYKTKERALEVLDEIHQRLIDLQTLEITPDFYKVCKRNLDNVYEIPKE